MTLNLRSLRTQILINDGTTNLDVSEAFEQLDLTTGVWDDSGWFKPRGTLRLAGFVYSIAESFDCRNNTSRWKPGNVVSISLWYGSWVALPWRLRILRYPNRPYPGNPSIEVEIGTDADLLNYRTPEGDPGGITYGNSTAAHTLVSAALDKAGGLALGTGQTVAGLSLPFSPSKTDGSSWITYAGQVAYAAGYVLWQHTNGEIRATPLTTEGLTPYAHYVVGRDEADYVPEVSQEQPPERVFVTGTTYRIDEVEDETNVVVDTVDGVTVRTTTSYIDRDTDSPEYLKLVEQPANLVMPALYTSGVMVTDAETTKVWQYGTRSRLNSEVETVRRPVGALFPAETWGTPTILAVADRTTITYTYSNDNVLRTRTTQLEQGIIAGNTATTAIVQITTEKWQKVGNEEYVYTRSQVNRNGEINPLPQRRGASTNNRPPATQYKPPTLQRLEDSYLGLATFTNLAGSGYADKLWSITLPSGMGTSNAQCAARAKTWGSIRQGRQFAISWAADLERGWLENFNPVRRIDFTVPETGRPYAAATAYSTGAIVFYRGLSYRARGSTTGNLPTNATFWEPANIRTAYLIEALNIAIDARSAAIGGRGVEVGRISTNAALPALPSTPGDAPTPGIPDPVPPFDVLIALDAQHQASVSPLTFAATSTSTPAAAHDVSISPLTFAAASRVYWVAQHAASVRPLTFAATAGVRPVVQHEASVGALTFAADVVGPLSAQHEASVGPLTFAATVIGPSPFASGLYTGNGTTQSITAGFQPDMVWIKPKTTDPPTLVDSTNGASQWWNPASSNTFATDANAITSFDANGFSIGNSARVNTNARDHRYFAFQKSSGLFNIISYTGTGSIRSVNHDMGVAPAFIVVKRVNGGNSSSSGYHKSSGGTRSWNMETTTVTTGNSTFWNNSDPTTTTFPLSTNSRVNANGSTYIAYLFAESSGNLKVDSYTGNGSASGPVVNVGFAPKIVLIRHSTAGLLHLYSSADSTAPFRFASDAEVTKPISFLSDGFQPGSTDADINANGVTYYYVAWR